MPMTRFGRMHPIMTCTNTAGGLPLPAITAPNIHCTSKRKREVCKQAGKLTSQVKNVGPKGHITHQAGDAYSSSSSAYSSSMISS